MSLHVRCPQERVVQPLVCRVTLSRGAHIGEGGDEQGPERHYQDDLGHVEVHRPAPAGVMRDNPAAGYPHLVEDTEPE